MRELRVSSADVYCFCILKLRLSVHTMTPLLFIIFLLLLASTSINGDTDPSDASALMAMYQNLNSPGQLTKWSSSGGDPCGESWKGIMCSSSRVTEIKLPSLGLSGGIGYQLSSLTSVTNFDVSNNNLGGQIPYSLPPNLQTLNLGGCGYTGTLPYSISDMTSLKYLNVAHNQISGQLADMFGKLSALSTLDLSSNSFMGDLPESFSLMSSATDMYLQNNQFAGSIDVLANLPLKNLNIANNRFTGWIPSQLSNINLQKDGNSFNSGPAPGTPPAGGGGDSQSQPSGNNSPSTGGSGKKSGIGGGGIAGIVISILVIGAVIVLFLLKKRSKKRSTADIEKTAPVSLQPQAVEVVEMKPVIKTSYETEDCILDDKDIIVPKKKSIDATSYSIADLQIATDSFSADSLIGEGSTGRVFRAQFEDGKVAAVKKIKSSALPAPGGDCNFIDIVSEVWRLNVTELMGYCCEHGHWDTAPEVSMSGQYTLKSDVYGFGVTMLELLTGRKPFDSSRTRAEQSLVRWATPQLHDMDALAKMVDPALKGLYPVKSLSRFASLYAYRRSRNSDHRCRKWLSCWFDLCRGQI